MIGGAALGHFRQQDPGFSAEDRERLTAELTGGKAALGVIVAAEKAALHDGDPGRPGRRTEAHEVTDEAVDAAAAAAAAAPESPEA